MDLKKNGSGFINRLVTACPYNPLVEDKAI